MNISKRMKTVVFGVIIGIGGIRGDCFGQDIKEPDSEALLALYSCFRGIDDGGYRRLSSVAEKWPAEVREELTRIAKLESDYYGANRWVGGVRGLAIMAAAQLYGHEPEFYKKLKALIPIAREAVWDKDIPEYQRIGPGAGYGVIGSIVLGLGVENRNDGALENVVDLIESGLLSTPHPWAGSRTQAYCALIDRYRNETDSSRRVRILEIVSYYQETEHDPPTRNHLIAYLKTTGIDAKISEMSPDDARLPNKWRPPQKSNDKSGDKTDGESNGGMPLDNKTSSTSANYFGNIGVVPAAILGLISAGIVLVSWLIFRHRIRH